MAGKAANKFKDIQDHKDKLTEAGGIHKVDPKSESITSTQPKPIKYVEVEYAPMCVWGLAVWSDGGEEYPAFLDAKGEWWWATTTNQNGINPAVEKTEPPVEWRPL